VGVVNTFTLDGEGKRRRLEDSAGLRNLLWDRENIVVETDSNQATVARYTLAPQLYGELVSQRRAGATSFHHFDALGSTSKLTDASQSPLAAYLYRAFGQQSILSGSSANPFTFVGRVGYYRQPDCQDYWVRARIMRPSTGRWLSRDPEPRLEGYQYSHNRPCTLTDPSGLDTQVGPLVLGCAGTCATKTFVALGGGSWGEFQYRCFWGRRRGCMVCGILFRVQGSFSCWCIGLQFAASFELCGCVNQYMCDVPGGNVLEAGVGLLSFTFTWTDTGKCFGFGGGGSYPPGISLAYCRCKGRLEGFGTVQHVCRPISQVLPPGFR